MLSSKFLQDFRRKTEARWGTIRIEPHLYGFQFRPGTRWNPGLTDSQIYDFERTLGFKLCTDLRTCLRELNGTDIPTVNVYGRSGEPERYGSGVYAYPRDLQEVRTRIGDVNRTKQAIAQHLKGEGFVLSDDVNLFPFYGHRYVICSADLANSTVLSIAVDEVDAIVYADSLHSYLEKEFLN